MERESDNPAEYIRNILVTEPANEIETGIYRRLYSETRFTDRLVPNVLTLRDLWQFAATTYSDNISYG
ncbi:MAG: hypothetical protein EZS28_047377, partial [Streblomastix strix]